MDRDQMVRLLYSAPAALPAQQGRGRLRRAPTSFDHNPATGQATQPASSHSAAGAPPPAQTANSPGTPPRQPEGNWYVLLLGTARQQYARKLLHSLQHTSPPCRIRTIHMDTLPWHQILCGPFDNRPNARTWAQQQALPETPRLYPSTLRIQPQTTQP